MDVEADAVARYVAAQALVAKLEAEWASAGEPVMAVGGATGRAPVPHPLVKMIQDARRDCDRFARALSKAHAGPAPSAVISSLGESPAARLRSVG